MMFLQSMRAQMIVLIISVDRHSILDNVGWSVGPSHYEDDLSNHGNMHENAVISVDRHST